MRLVAEEVSCVRGGRTLFRDLSFALAAGEAIAITGPNGAGKTSLLRIAAGLLAPTEGKIALTDTESSVGEACHFLGHLDAVKGALTVSENLDFYRALLGGARAANEAALSRVGLASLADLPGYVLSAGQRRRLALARLIAAPRPIWLLDEPTASLDTAGQELLTGLMSEHRARGGIVVAATHLALDLADARGLSLSAGDA